MTSKYFALRCVFGHAWSHKDDPVQSVNQTPPGRDTTDVAGCGIIPQAFAGDPYEELSDLLIDYFVHGQVHLSGSESPCILACV